LEKVMGHERRGCMCVRGREREALYWQSDGSSQ
jgi:hypothetical protein